MASERPSRVRAAPARLEDEQAEAVGAAALLAQFSRRVVSSDSEEEEGL